MPNANASPDPESHDEALIEGSLYRTSQELRTKPAQIPAGSEILLSQVAYIQTTPWGLGRLWHTAQYDRPLRHLAHTALGRIGAEAVKYVEAQLATRQVHDRLQARDFLAKQGSLFFLPEIFAALMSTRETDRRAALEEAEAIGKLELLPHIQRLLSDPNPSVRLAAKWAEERIRRVTVSGGSSARVRMRDDRIGNRREPPCRRTHRPRRRSTSSPPASAAKKERTHRRNGARVRAAARGRLHVESVKEKRVTAAPLHWRSAPLCECSPNDSRR
jgi:hypothetical protein